MNKRYLIWLLCVLSILMDGQNIFAQTQKPKWTEGFFEEGTNTYLQCFDASGYDQYDARVKAINKIYESRGVATGAELSISIKNDGSLVDGKKDLTVKARIIDEYHENISPGNHKVYLLVQMAKNPTYDFDRVQLTEKYKFTPKVFIPGMAQINKGSVKKGVLFITGEVFFVGGIVFAESMRQNNINKISSTHDADMVKIYTNNANTWVTVRDISIAGAAIVYVWNIIDGIIANGEKHIILGDARINISPYSNLQSTGIALFYKF